MDTELEKARKLAIWIRDSFDNFMMTGNIKNNSWREDGRMVFDNEGRQGD